ncbi:MAG: tetratricopeptide repeat protein [Candidatus Rokubacteria bacterium]|nr:tetratricopeptide repeat protein [Candidatus Rokubacteria bacterium]
MRATAVRGIGVFLLVLSVMLGADEPSADLPDEARRLLEAGESAFDAEALGRARSLFDQLARSGVPSPSVPYYQARVALALVGIHAWRKETDRALGEIDQAIASARTAIQQLPQHSDAHRILGEAYGRLISLKGGMTGVLYGRRSYNELALALKLDPDNPRAALAMGIWKLRTPKLFGGDPDEAVRHFQKAIQLEAASVQARVWLGIALRERGQRAEAREVLERAVALQPQNVWARSELDRLR